MQKPARSKGAGVNQREAKNTLTNVRVSAKIIYQKMRVRLLIYKEI